MSVKRTSAHAYDPLGDEEEHSDEASRVVDRDEGTAWSTESYSAGIEGAGKPGRRHLHRRQAQGRGRPAADRDARAGLAGDDLRRASRRRCPKSVPEGWTKVGGGTVNEKDKTFKLDTGGVAYRYYLVWITKLADGAKGAEISEIRLFQEVAGLENCEERRRVWRRDSVALAIARKREAKRLSQQGSRERASAALRLPELREDAQVLVKPASC